MDTTPKLEDHGVHCLFMGYSLSHPNESYQMYDPKTQHVQVSHDVVWLHCMFYQKAKTTQELNMDLIAVGNWTRNT